MNTNMEEQIDLFAEPNNSVGPGRLLSLMTMQTYQPDASAISQYLAVRRLAEEHWMNNFLDWAKIHPVEAKLFSTLFEQQIYIKTFIFDMANDIIAIHSKIDLLVEDMNSGRRDPHQGYINAHVWLLTKHYHCTCPICRDEQIVENGHLLSSARFHHHVDRSNANFDATIIIGEKCHKRLPLDWKRS